jgi:catechol 2,3-dioxygenase-like lactoylglutathione lyase family enzyme
LDSKASTAARYREPVTRALINHVSIGAQDLQDSVEFYTEIFGAEQIDTPNFGFPVQWLRIGDLQLHLFKRPGPAPTYHHLALAVDDFEAVYRATRARGIHDAVTMGAHLNELPSGQVQLYIRDPGGNLVEVNWPDARDLSDELRQEMVRLEDRQPQNESNRSAELYLDERKSSTRSV